MNSYTLLVVGPHGCGKTTWIKSLQERRLVEQTLATIGLDLFFVDTIFNSERVHVGFYDSSGNIPTFSILSPYTSKVSATVIMCDMENYNSLKECMSWLDNISGVKIFLGIVPESDEKEYVLFEEIKEELRDKNCCYFSMTRTYSSMVHTFNSILSCIPPEIPKDESSSSSSDSGCMDFF